jgi:predicted acylesterase/phospholipase RssA
MENIPQRTIKHIVISGGAEWGFTGFGILYEAIETGFVNMEDIESMYMCSAGSIIGCMLALKIDSKIIHDYIIKRPWEMVCKQNKYSVLDIYDSKGLIHIGFFENMFSSLLKSVDLPVDITLDALYEYNHIDIHIFTTEINACRLIDISHKTHPKWRFIDAIYASSSVPIVFSPIIRENHCYMDGGILLNYPIAECCKHVENLSEVFGISLGNYDAAMEKDVITSQSNIMDVVSIVISKIIKYNKLFSNHKLQCIPYQIHCIQNTTIETCMDALYNKEFRKTLIYNGIDRMKMELYKWFSKEMNSEENLENPSGKDIENRSSESDVRV